MKKMRMTILSLVAFAVLVGYAVQDADAGIRVQATVRTPNVRVHVGNTPSGHYRSYARVKFPLRKNHHYRVTKRDRTIARRLAWYTGVPTRRLIQIRSQGYRWFEIGRWLHLPRPVVRAAMHQQSWKRFLREERRFARRGNHPNGGRRIAYVDDDGYYGDDD